MKEKIKAIEEYLKYFPNDFSAKNNLLLYTYTDELGIELTGRYYPRIEYSRLVINNQIQACKKFELTNSLTGYNQNGVDTLIVWSENCGRLAFIDARYWADVEEEWSEFMGILKSYDPLDYDDINGNYIYNIENGKRLISDYGDILKKMKEKFTKKINSVKLNNKIAELERLKKELSE